MLDVQECRDECKGCESKFKCIPLNVAIFVMLVVFVLFMIVDFFSFIF